MAERLVVEPRAGEPVKTGWVHEQTGSASEDAAEFWVAYDGKALYYAARAHTDPHKLITDEFRQNVNLGGNDQFLIAIDTKGGTNFNQFGIGAGGGTEIRLAGGRAAKTEWLGEMEVQSRVTADGWQMEARIPWEVMDMPSAGTHDMRFNVGWLRSTKGAAYLYKFGDQGQQSWPFLRGVVTGEVKRPRVVKLLPYAYLGFDDNHQAIANAGLDLKTPVGKGLELVATANPDFRNVENDILSLDFSYFARLADDPRPFFQEGSQYRRVGHYQRTFASQNIRDIDYGVNLYGSPDNQSQLGVLTTVDAGKQQTIVASYTRQPTPAESWTVTYVGDLEPGVRSHTGDINYSLQRGRFNYYAGVRGTDDRETKSGLQTDFNTNYSDNRGFNSSLGLTTISRDYAPRLGFTPEADIATLNSDTDWTRTFKKGAISQAHHYLGLMSSDHVSGGFNRNAISTYDEWQWRNHFLFGFWISRPNFQGSADQEFNAHVTYPFTDPNRNFTFQIDNSRYGGKDYRRKLVTWAARPMKHLQSQLTAEFVEFGGAQTQIIGSLRYDRGRYESFGVRVIRRDSDLNWSLSYRLSGRKGIEYYIAFGDANARTFQHQLVLKVVAPFEFRF